MDTGNPSGGELYEGGTEVKTIGLIGGLSWESSLVYYRIINEAVKHKLGGLHSARCIMYSVDFGPIEKMMSHGAWPEVSGVMADAGQQLEKAGADCIVICSNTVHKVAEPVQSKIGIPVLHIADTTAWKMKDLGMKKVGLLGTRFVMEGDFYKERLREKHGIDVLVPNERERKVINDVIFNELCLGKFNQASKENLQEIIRTLVAQGAEGIVLGCTEIPLLINQGDAAVPVLDTMTLHAHAAVDFALE